MKLPLIIVNFKTYKQAIGENAVNLAKICEKVAKSSGKTIIVAVTNNDVYRVAKAVSIPVFSQHIDAIEYGAYTGHVLPENVKESGASGVLINHSEDRIKIADIKRAVELARRAGLISAVCAATPLEVAKFAEFRPDFIAIEPPELISGKISVSRAKPEVIINSLKKVKKIPLLTGAGVKTTEDVKLAINYGTKGVLIASGVAKSEDPEKALSYLVKGL